MQLPGPCVASLLCMRSMTAPYLQTDVLQTVLQGGPLRGKTKRRCFIAHKATLGWVSGPLLSQ